MSKVVKQHITCNGENGCDENERHDTQVQIPVQTLLDEESARQKNCLQQEGKKCLI